MALNLLLETYADVTSLKTIESADIFESRRITVVLLPHSVVLINVRTIDLVSAKLASFIGATQEYSQELKYSIHLFFDSLGWDWSNPAYIRLPQKKGNESGWLRLCSWEQVIIWYFTMTEFCWGSELVRSSCGSVTNFELSEECQRHLWNLQKLHLIDSPEITHHKRVTNLHWRCFLVAFAGSSLAAIAENAVSTANIDYISWPQQPLKLFSVKGKGIVVVCADSTVWHIALSNGVVPAATFT